MNRIATYQGGLPWRRVEFTLYDDRVHVLERRLFGEKIETEVELVGLCLPAIKTLLRSEIHQVIYGIPGLLMILLAVAIGEYLYGVSVLLFVSFVTFSAGLWAIGIWKAKKVKGYVWYPSSEGGLGLDVSESLLCKNNLEAFASEVTKAIEKRHQQNPAVEAQLEQPE